MDSFMDRLEKYGVDIPKTMERFVGDQELYRDCLAILLQDKNFAELGRAIEARKFDDAYNYAHTLKGVVGNLGLTPLCNTICVLSDSLKAKEIGNLDNQFKSVMAAFDAVVALA